MDFTTTTSYPYHYHNFYNYHHDYRSYIAVIFAIELLYYWSDKDWLWVRAGYTTNGN